MTKNQATKRPWTVEGTEVYDSDGLIPIAECCVRTLNNYLVDTPDANAELIVRAVNCHDELVESLQQIIAMYELNVKCDINSNLHPINKGKQALAKAQEE